MFISFLMNLYKFLPHHDIKSLFILLLDQVIIYKVLLLLIISIYFPVSLVTYLVSFETYMSIVSALDIALFNKIGISSINNFISIFTSVNERFIHRTSIWVIAFLISIIYCKWLKCYKAKIDKS